jgi:hypothetical protein
VIIKVTSVGRQPCLVAAVYRTVESKSRRKARDSGRWEDIWVPDEHPFYLVLQPSGSVEFYADVFLQHITEPSVFRAAAVMGNQVVLSKGLILPWPLPKQPTHEEEMQRVREIFQNTDPAGPRFGPDDI